MFIPINSNISAFGLELPIKENILTVVNLRNSFLEPSSESTFLSIKLSTKAVKPSTILFKEGRQPSLATIGKPLITAITSKITGNITSKK